MLIPVARALQTRTEADLQPIVADAVPYLPSTFRCAAGVVVEPAAMEAATGALLHFSLTMSHLRV